MGMDLSCHVTRDWSPLHRALTGRSCRTRFNQCGLSRVLFIANFVLKRRALIRKTWRRSIQASHFETTQRGFQCNSYWAGYLRDVICQQHFFATKSFMSARDNTRRKRAKNVFSLASFGHSPLVPSSSLPPSTTARTGSLSADGRRADVEVIPLEREPVRVSSTPAGNLALDNEDGWMDVLGGDDDLQDQWGGGLGGVKNPRKRKWYATTVRPFFTACCTS